MTDIGRLADAVMELDGGVPQRVSDLAPDATLDDAYAVRDLVLARREAAGDRLRGVKLGGTPPLVDGQPWNELAIGWLTDSMFVEPDAVLARDDFVMALAEPELALVLRDDIGGPGLTGADVLEATDRVHGALEIMDCRAPLPLTDVDVIASNVAASRVVLGSIGIDPFEADLSLLGCVFERDGHIVGTASGAAVLGHPGAAVAALANAVAARGESLRAGSVVLAGGLIAPTPVGTATSLTALFSLLGRVGIAIR